jgi:hypothetical protein
MALILLLFRCSQPNDSRYETYVVFPGGDNREIHAVRIPNNGSWIGIAYRDGCTPSTVFYKTPENLLLRSDNDRDGREYCFPDQKIGK